MLESLSLFNFIMSTCLVVGGVIAYRYGFSRTANEVQERVISALQSEVQTLHDRLASLEQENARLNQNIVTICTALKRRGVHLSIDGNTICIRDESDHSYTSYNTNTSNTKNTHNTNTRIHGQTELPLTQELESEATTVTRTARRRRSKRESSLPETEGEK